MYVPYDNHDQVFLRPKTFRIQSFCLIITNLFIFGRRVYSIAFKMYNVTTACGINSGNQTHDHGVVCTMI